MASRRAAGGRRPERARLVHSRIGRVALAARSGPSASAEWGAVPRPGGARSHAGTAEARSGPSWFGGEGASRPVSRVLYGAEGEPAARDDHSSGTTVAGRLERSTRATARKRVGRQAGMAGPRPVAPIRSCSRWGLPCRRRCRLRGALLPHPFTLTRTGRSLVPPGGLLSVALSLGSPPPDVIRHRVSVEPGLSSALARDGRPAGWPGLRIGCGAEREAAAYTRTGWATRPAWPKTRR